MKRSRLRLRWDPREDGTGHWLVCCDCGRRRGTVRRWDNGRCFWWVGIGRWVEPGYPFSIADGEEYGSAPKLQDARTAAVVALLTLRHLPTRSRHA